MNSLSIRMLRILLLFLLAAAAHSIVSAQETSAHKRYLYVATPGIRNYLEYGGHGLLVFDIDAGHKFVKRIKTAGLDEQGRPLNVKGICASAASGRVFISTIRQLMCLDLASEQILWERRYDAGADRMSITPDGKTIFLPSLEGPHWYVVSAEDGSVTDKIVVNSGAHNTVCGLSGRHAYLAGLKSPLLRVVDTQSLEVRTIGPFSASIRPFTVDGRERRCYVNVNELLGFEVGDLETGAQLFKIEVQGFSKGPVKRHGCPSHGIGLSPDERELWLTDAHNRRLHIFDISEMPPRQTGDSIELRDEPGWISFSIDGAYAYPSTGDVIDTKTRAIVAALTDETGQAVQSEKLLEIDWTDGKVTAAGNQFGIGRIGQ